LVELVPPPDCETAVLNTSSIVAVHGLNPTNRKNHAFQTWESSVGGHLWLRDKLPEVAPRARILLYQYDSFPALTDTKTRFVWAANSLLGRLEMERYRVSKEAP
jgi:hypothetical protein